MRNLSGHVAIARRTVQALSFALLLGAPVLGLWGVGTENRYNPEELRVRYSGAAEHLAPALHRIGDLPESALARVVGAPWSLQLFGIELTDPLAILQLAGAFVAPPMAMAVGAVLVLAVQALVGRGFCGWACPYGIASRAVLRLRPPLQRLGLAIDVQPPRWLRWVLLAAVPAGAIAGVSVSQAVLPYLVLSRSVHGVLFGSSLGAAGLLSALLLSDLLLWDHGVCRGICPSGAWMRLWGRLRVTRLVARKAHPCERGCHECSRICWLGLDPRSGKVPDDCDSCGRCIPVCPNSRLEIVLRSPA